MQPPEQRVSCPICGCNNLEHECAHLIFHGDDLRTKEVLESCGSARAWDTLRARLPDCLPELASCFFDQFGDRFPSFAGFETAIFEGGAPGLSSVHCYVWERMPGTLGPEIRAFLEGLLRGLQPKAEMCRETNGKEMNEAQTPRVANSETRSIWHHQE